jgi:ubiquinone/menaquinone biosynthesis C-methylase UbiE
LVLEGRLYTDLAQYYDQIYHWKDYRKEVSKVRALVRKYKHSQGTDLLDVACGTGKHLSFLRRDFRCVGVDSSAAMLAVARRNVSGVRFVQADMRELDLGKKFDVILCLFSAIGHIRTKNEVRRTLLNFASHLKKGGVLIVEPWIQASQWKDKTTHMQIYDTKPLKIIRLNYSWTDGTFSYLDERYLIGKERKGIDYVVDRHLLRFFEPDFALSVLRKAGLEAEFVQEGLMPDRGLLIATRSL